MKLHANARACPHGRLLAVKRIEEQGWTLRAAAEAAGVSVRTISKWLGRDRSEGEQGLCDRSSAPGSVPHRIPEERVQAIAALRGLRMTAAEIAHCLVMPLSTVSAVRTRIGLGKLSRLEPPEPANRYERRRPGELVHVDVEKLGRIGRPGHRLNGDRRTRSRGIGWEYVHVAIDDATPTRLRRGARRREGSHRGRLPAPCARPLPRLRVRVERVMTDNGSAYVSIVHAFACKALQIKHLRTRPCRPRTNGKAERFIRTLLGGWAYGAIYGNSDERRRALAGWLDFYNHRRPHGSLSHQPPLQRLEALKRNNLAGSYI